MPAVMALSLGGKRVWSSEKKSLDEAEYEFTTAMLEAWLLYSGEIARKYKTLTPESAKRMAMDIAICVTSESVMKKYSLSKTEMAKIVKRATTQRR